ncbi:MAG: hypothetical protein FJ125_08490, partial [Deltaproteobacteria bacterium]|nr:hypothetical protein [Deltaproteobacteria bacterium]
MAQLSLDVRSCMIGTRRGVAGQEGGLCDRAITERFAGGLTACLALRVDGQDRVLPFVLQGKNLVPASDRTVSLPAGEPIQLKLFVLQPGASPEACAGYDVDTVCAGGDEPGPASCLFAMRQEQVQVSGGKGTTIVYGTADAPCGIECNDGCAPADAGCRRICGTMAAPLAEVCNGRDDDCDGQTDEGFVSEATSCGLGQCRASGVTSCAAGEVIDSCSPGEPRPEQCNGQDDDCDGLTDEELGGEPTSCGNGACAARGETVCSNGRLHDTCSPGAPPSERDATCDGVDDDCDRQADEDHAPRATSCGTGVCTAAGLTSCVQGREQDSCTPGMPEAAADTLCDGRDDDCDGQTDEDYRPIDTSCGRGACAARGLSFCQAGQEQDSCTANPPPAASDTSCNGRDDDCDGQTDEDHVPPATLCGKGVCARAGWLLCELGELRDTCVPGQPPAARDESCDGVDDDCNGVEDEDHVPGPSGCGVGDCAAVGISFCSGGQLRDTCVPGQPAATEVCDRRDNDCDGTTDESCGCVPGSYEPQRITCGTGACASVGWTACREGSIEERCTPGQPLARTDTTCDGVDDDCDGQADDDFTPSPTSCGVGACRAEGQLVCAEGRRGDSCLPLLAQREADATCDGVDDDCDGRSDEDYVSRDSTCGVGACRATGRTYCVQGGVVDSCRPGPPRAASDATCDGVDDDCDQAVDEDYAVVATSCGQGACAASGQRICEQGRTKSTCVAKSPLAARDESCDGVDDDCDSRTDEEHSGQQITCGDGPCAATGITACLLGREESFCLPRPPLAETDESCDGVDDDCDGSPDDEYLAIAVSCGIGACRDEGLTACRDGAVIGSCISREAALDDTTCDGVDDDCDGLVDESCPC